MDIKTKFASPLGINSLLDRASALRFNERSSRKQSFKHLTRRYKSGIVGIDLNNDYFKRKQWFYQPGTLSDYLSSSLYWTLYCCSCEENITLGINNKAYITVNTLREVYKRWDICEICREPWGADLKTIDGLYKLGGVSSIHSYFESLGYRKDG